MRQMRYISTLLLLLMATMAMTAAAQRTVNGSIVNGLGKAVSGAVVKVAENGRTKVFCRSGKDGKWTLKVPETNGQLRLKVEHISYAPAEMVLPEGKEPVIVVLEERNRQLKEVTVKAPSVTQRGDTISFNLDSFKGKGDVTLEESMKKVPGVSVTDDGTIRYLDKPISNFYIEGLDLMGGRYAMATRNLPAEYVKSVEILSRHQDLKKDKGRYSDKVAVNIRLKEKAKFKPMGTTDVAAGYGDNKVRYYGSATGMMFNKALQCILTAKYGNIEEVALSNRMLVVSALGLNRSSAASNAVGSLASNRPPLPTKRYADPRDLLTSLNVIKKTGKDATMKANASYTQSRSEYEYNTSTTYFTGETPLTVSQGLSPNSVSHNPSLELEYKLNREDRYCQNMFKVDADIIRREIATQTDEGMLNQRQRGHTVDISDVFSHSIKSDKREWNLTSRVAYGTTPSMALRAVGNSGNDFVQEAQSTGFVAEQKAYTTFRAKRAVVYMPIVVKYDYTDLGTHLDTESQVTGRDNRVYYNQLRAGLEPMAEYNSPDLKYSLRFSLPLGINYINGHNSMTGTEVSSTRPIIIPSASFEVNMSSVSSLSLNASTSYNIGDPLDLLVAPVQTSWRNITIRSGELARQSGVRAGVRYDLKLPFDFWFFSASVNYAANKQNMLSSQYVDADQDVSSFLLSDHTTQTLTGSANVSKTVQSIRSKFALGCNWSQSRSEMIQQDIPVVYRSSTLSLTPSINLSPVDLIEAGINATMTRSWNKYLGSSSSLNSMNLAGRMSVFITSKLELRMTADHVTHQLPDRNYKNMTLFDASLRLKIKKSLLVLSMDNVLNTKSYDYTVFHGLDTSTYSYRLRGRMLTLSLRLTR